MFRLLPRRRRVDHLLALNEDVVHAWPHAEHASSLSGDGKALELLNVGTICHEHVGSGLFRANELVTLGRLGHVVLAYRAGVLGLALLRLIDACRQHLALLSCRTASLLVLALQIGPCPPLLLVVVVVVSAHALVKHYELVRSSILKAAAAGVAGGEAGVGLRCANPTYVSFPISERWH